MLQQDSSVKRENFILGDLTIDIGARSVTRDSKDLHLTTTEFDLLAVFLIRRGEILTREDLLNGLGLTESPGCRRRIDMQVTRLRRKIEPCLERPKYLKTIRKKGYILTPLLDAPYISSLRPHDNEYWTG